MDFSGSSVCNLITLHILWSMIYNKNIWDTYKWYNEKEVPGLMKFKGILKATRYKLVNTPKNNPGVSLLSAEVSKGGYPEFLAMY